MIEIRKNLTHQCHQALQKGKKCNYKTEYLKNLIFKFNIIKTLNNGDEKEKLFFTSNILFKL